YIHLMHMGKEGYDDEDDIFKGESQDTIYNAKAHVHLHSRLSRMTGKYLMKNWKNTIPKAHTTTVKSKYCADFYNFEPTCQTKLAFQIFDFGYNESLFSYLNKTYMTIGLDVIFQDPWWLVNVDV
ncbi:hypothetical protein ACJX0J_023533, partial [Zea mays]